MHTQALSALIVHACNMSCCGFVTRTCVKLTSLLALEWLCSPFTSVKLRCDIVHIQTPPLPQVNIFLCLLQYLLTQMREMGIPPDGLAYGALITAYAAAKQPRKAAAVMQDFVNSGGKVTCISDLTATTSALSHFLTELSSSEYIGHPAACSMLLACVQPSLVLCNQLTNAWSKTGAAGEIRAVMASMRLMGMRPDVYTWSSLVHAHAVARQTGRYTTATAMLLLLLHTAAAVMLLLQTYCCCCAHARSVCEMKSASVGTWWRGCADVLTIVCMIQALM